MTEILAFPRIIYYNGIGYSFYNGLGAVLREGDIDYGEKKTADQRVIYFIAAYAVSAFKSDTYSNQRTVYSCFHRVFR